MHLRKYMLTLNVIYLRHLKTSTVLEYGEYPQNRQVYTVPQKIRG